MQFAKSKVIKRALKCHALNVNYVNKVVQIGAKKALNI